MAEIEVLAPEVANMIAAGEVVDRPASVVKELMENAVDAAATSITVEISGGNEIRISDNGSGIPANQLEKAFLRHATSKLQNADNLSNISTLGFRGEALAAIAAVSKIEVISATNEGEFAQSICLEGGILRKREEKQRSQGTTIEVKDIFFNTPARKKFMKSERSESATIYALVQELALSHPEISIKFIREGKEELQTLGDGKMESAVFQVLGKNIASGLREVDLQDLDSRVSGFISLPSCCRASRNYQHFFVNGRYVKSPLFSAAVENGYKNAKMVGRFPAAVLHLQLNFNEVDVNVHPAKTQVKFAHEKEVFQLIYQAVKQTVARNSDIQRVELKKDNTDNLKTPALPEAVSAPLLQEELQDKEGPMQEMVQTAPQVVSVEKAKDIPKINYNFSAFSMIEEENLENDSVSDVLSGLQQKSSVGLETVSLASVPFEDKVLIPTENQENSLTFPEKEEELEQIPMSAFENTENWRVVGEFFKTYIAIEVGEEIFLVDKHAAHERMNFERMQAQGYTPMGQVLMKPVVLSLSPAEKSILLENLPLFQEFSFEIEEFSLQSVIVRAAPYDVPEEKIEETLQELIQKLQDGDLPDPKSARDSLLHTMACKSAIKAGFDTKEEEQQLLAKIIMEDKIHHCPHGRPIVASLSKKDLEKKFKRLL